MADVALIVGLVAIFCAVVIALATVGVLTGEREQVGKSLAAIEAFQAAPASMRKELDKPFGERVWKPFLKESSGLGRRLTPSGQVERIRKRLDAAGSPTGWDVDRVLAFKVLGALGGVLVTILASPVSLSFGPIWLAVSAVIFVVGGFFVPDMAIYQLGYNRANQMRKDLPDALDLLTISVEAGLAFDAAMAQVARQTEGPLADGPDLDQLVGLGAERQGDARASGDDGDQQGHRPALLVEQRVVDLQASRADHDDEESWQDAEDQRKEDLDGHLLRLLLGALASLEPHLLGLDPKDVRDRDAESVSLNQRRDECLDVIDVCTFGHGAERIGPAEPDLHLLKDPEELLGERTLGLTGYLCHGGVEREPCLDADGQQIERVGEVLAHLVRSVVAELVDRHVRHEESADHEDEGGHA